MRPCRSNLNRQTDGCLNAVLSSSNFWSILHSRSYSLVLIDALISLFIKSLSIKKSLVLDHEGKYSYVKIPPRRNREFTNVTASTTSVGEDWFLMFYPTFLPKKLYNTTILLIKTSGNKYCYCASSFRKKTLRQLAMQSYAMEWGWVFPLIT